MSFNKSGHVQNAEAWLQKAETKRKSKIQTIKNDTECFACEEWINTNYDDGESCRNCHCYLCEDCGPSEWKVCDVCGPFCDGCEDEKDGKACCPRCEGVFDE
jgi:hypothetical protein